MSKLYIVRGVDPTGRRFSGLYTEQDARYLATISRLNRVIDRDTQAVIQFTYQPTNGLENICAE